MLSHSNIGNSRMCLFAAVFLLAAVVGCDSSPEADGPRLTHRIGRGDLTVSVTEQGTLESSSNTEIKCKVRGSSTVLWVIETGTAVEPGTELVRIDPSQIEDRINQQEIVYQRALATHTNSETAVAVAAIGITEYEEGTFRTQMKTLQKDLAIAESNLRTTKNLAEHSTRMFKRGYASELEVEGNQFAVKQAQLELELKETEIDVLDRFTKAKQMEELTSALKAASATLASDKAALDLEKARLDREKEQLANCSIVSPSSGMVIYPSAAQWKEQPDIEEGATVRQDQILLLIPDLEQMQVKVGIHESKVDQLKVEMKSRVTLQEAILNGKVDDIASVTKPAGWWTGNVVKYDTIVKLDNDHHLNLKPGMTVEVEIILAEHTDVLMVPVAAVVEQGKQFFCWVKTATGPEKRRLDLGDSDDQFMVVEGGIKEGDDVILNPRAFIEDARDEALQPVTDEESDTTVPGSSKSSTDKTTTESKPDKERKESTDSDSNEKAPDGKKATPSIREFAQKAIDDLDQDGDGALTKDEYKEEHRKHFDLADTDSNGKVDLQEMEAALQQLAASQSGKSS